MKKLIHEIFFGKNTLLSGLMALFVVGSIALGCNCNKDLLSNTAKDENTAPASSPATTTTTSSTKPDASTGKAPTDDQMQTMVRKTVLDFNDAIQSGDFTDFRSTCSKPFQKQASADKMEGVFHEFVEAKLNFKAVKDLDARFTSAPEVVKDSGYKVLVAKGVYATTPRKTNFELKYLAEGENWNLNSIEINTKDQ
jgi:hypothetical protein